MYFLLVLPTTDRYTSQAAWEAAITAEMDAANQKGEPGAKAAAVVGSPACASDSMAVATVAGEPM